MEGDAAPYIRRCAAQISIHALRVEGDRAEMAEAASICAISIHALRVEGDPENPDFDFSR